MNRVQFGFASTKILDPCKPASNASTIPSCNRNPSGPPGDASFVSSHNTS